MSAPDARALVAKLRDVGADKILHVYHGECPDPVDGPAPRDKRCPAARVPVTVSEPVTRDISADDVRAYIGARGWTESPHPSSPTFWTWHDPGDSSEVAVQLPRDNWRGEVASFLRSALGQISIHERRPPADVLRDIAAPCGAICPAGLYAAGEPCSLDRGHVVRGEHHFAPAGPAPGSGSGWRVATATAPDCAGVADPAAIDEPVAATLAEEER